MCVFFQKIFISMKYFIGKSHKKSLKKLDGLKMM